MYVKGKVIDILRKIAGNREDKLKIVIEKLKLENILERDVKHLSGGELQKLAIAAALLRDADVYILDEPTTHLDVVERLRVCEAIKEITQRGKYTIVIDHDLAVLDYLADLVVILYGKPGAYGIVSRTRGAREGLNEYLQGYLTVENMVIRDRAITFRTTPPERSVSKEKILVEWTSLKKNLGDFKLEVESGHICRGEIVGVLGPNGIGKTTFAKLLVGELEPDEGTVIPYGEVRISYKPQYVRDIAVKYSEYTVRRFLAEFAGRDFIEKPTWPDISSGLNLEPILDRELGTLSGGEVQRVVVAASLLKDAELYVLDEPMAYLDIEQRIRVATVIKRIVEEKEAVAFIVEHDITMIDYLANCIIVFSGEPGKYGKAVGPVGLREGMNMFLKEQDITFRREPKVGRPRINKRGSVLDRMQREIGEYYYYIPQREES